MPTTATNDRARDLLDRLERDDIAHLWVVYADYNGRTQGKSVPRARFPSTVGRGITFAKANLGHNVTDHAPADTAFGADSGDFFAVPDPAAYAPYPLVADTGRAVCWMRQEGGAAWDGCPRTRLARQVAAYADLGLRLQVAFEPEAYLLKEGADGAILPAAATGMFTVAGLDAHAPLLHRLSETLEVMGVGVEQVAPEYGPGQVEVNIRHAPPIKAADDLLAVKDVLRALAHDAGLIASFMPKPFTDAAGAGLHVHLSLWDDDGERSAMEEEPGEREGHASGLSAVGRAFVAGLLRHAPALTGLGAPTVNSAKRRQPATWAPAHAAYAVGNRAALLRIPGGSRSRVEVRAGDNTSNPYLYLTAILAAGLAGITEGLDPGPPAEGDLGHISNTEAAARGIPLLPRSAAAALDAVAADEVVAEALGPVIHPEWLRVKRSEIAAYDLIVSAWEREAYLRS